MLSQARLTAQQFHLRSTSIVPLVVCVSMSNDLVRHVTNYAKSEPINVIMYDFNLVSDLFNFGLDRNQFKQLVKIRLGELL